MGYLPHISTYFKHIYTYLYIFSCIFLLISTYLPQKCGILPQFSTKVWYYCTTVYRYLPIFTTKVCNEINYYKTILKNLTTPIFLVCLIYRWVKGQNSKIYVSM